MTTYYHYTNEEGYQGILKTGEIRPSFKSQGDANFGDGVYLTTIAPTEIAMCDDDSIYDLVIELFGLTGSIDRLDYFFELILPEGQVSNFSELLLDLGINPQELKPYEIRRICLCKTISSIEIGAAYHGKTIN